MNRPKLSVLITAYEQTELLRWNLDKLTADGSDGFEIVVQDDCSTEDIRGLIRAYDDPRIAYYRNPENYGHDRNIIEGFKNCRSEHVFLLRSSDTMIPGKIKVILDHIDKYPDAAYGRFSCLDEKGKPRIRYRDIYTSGIAENVRLNEKLLIHPSGELFNKRYLKAKDLKKLASYLDENFHDKNRFVLNGMMRNKLCMRAPFFSSSEIVWIYSRTTKRRDVARNRNSEGICIYAPLYMYERFRCEMTYIAKEVRGNKKTKEAMFIHEFDLYARMTVYDFKKINKDPAMQRHYGFREVPYSTYSELHRFREEAVKLAAKLPEEYARILLDKAKGLYFGNIICWKLRDLCITAMDKARLIMNRIISR